MEENDIERVVWLHSAQLRRGAIPNDDDLIGLALQAMRLPTTLSKSQIEHLGWALLAHRLPNMVNVESAEVESGQGSQ